MRYFAFLATIFAAAVSTSSALVDASERTFVGVNATAYDTRTFDSGCTPNGCVPENTRDGIIAANSRWSCQGNLLDTYGDQEGCCITYDFEEAQDVFRMSISFHEGGRNTPALDVYINGDRHSTIASRESTTRYQWFYLDTDKTEDIKLCLDDPTSDGDAWLSITEVKLMVH